MQLYDYQFQAILHWIFTTFTTFCGRNWKIQEFFHNQYTTYARSKEVHSVLDDFLSLYIVWKLLKMSHSDFKKLAKMDKFWHFLSTDHSKCKRSSLRSQCKMRHFCNFQTLCVAAFLFLLLLVNFLYCVACRYWKIGSRNHFLIFSMIRGLCVAICCLEFHDVKIKVRNVK